MVRADEASKRAKVQDLFVTMHMERTMNQLMNMVMKQTRQMTNGMPGMDQMTAEQKKSFTEKFSGNYTRPGRNLIMQLQITDGKLVLKNGAMTVEYNWQIAGGVRDSVMLNLSNGEEKTVVVVEVQDKSVNFTGNEYLQNTWKRN